MKILRTVSELVTYRRQIAPAAQVQDPTPATKQAPGLEVISSVSTPVGFVPTMGALHNGHVSLMNRLRPHVNTLIVSIFVNPKQFGPNEDFGRYPQTWEADLAACEQAQVDAIFAPEVSDFYPSNFSFQVEETQLSQVLCGAARPGHFKGVTTVVAKLFHLVDPHVSLFGLKDAQQYLILKKMANDLCFPTLVLGAPTLRESDGLAMSSRNRYLSPQERTVAPQIFRSLKKLSLFLPEGNLNRAALAAEQEVLKALGIETQYLEARTLPDLRDAFTSETLTDPSAQSPTTTGLGIFFAGLLGSTRLIDNILIWSGKQQQHGILGDE